MSYYSKYIRRVICSTASILPVNITHTLPSQIILPTYHSITDHTPDHLKFLYKPRTKKEFLNDLEFILKIYKPIDLQQLIKIVHKKEEVSNNLFHISFDDGLKECYEVIAPILKEKGIPATFFINPSFIGNKNLMFRYKASILINKILKEKRTDYKNKEKEILNINYINRHKLDEYAQSLEVNFSEYLNREKPYMEAKQIETLIKEGFTIGAHSMDHPRYSHISLEEQLSQTRQSIDYLTKEFHLNYRVFAFPFTDDDISKKYFDIIFSPDKPIADLTFGVAGIKEDVTPLHLQRIPMENNYSAKQIIKGEIIYYNLKKLLNKNTIRRKN